MITIKTICDYIERNKLENHLLIIITEQGNDNYGFNLQDNEIASVLGNELPIEQKADGVKIKDKLIHGKDLLKAKDQSNAGVSPIFIFKSQQCSVEVEHDNENIYLCFEDSDSYF